MSNKDIRSFFARWMALDWRLATGLVLLVCIPRFVFVLRANETANYGSISIIMAVSAILPFVLLSKNGRRRIGINHAANRRWLLYAFIIGLGISFILFLIGKGLYGDTVKNWFVYIGNSYNVPEEITSTDKLIYFLIFAITGMLFSPFGEELFFRGIVHAGFANSLGERKAAVLDSLSFSLTHVAHFGLVYVSGIWTFLPIPAILWSAGMFLTSLAFIWCKNMTGSIFGAIISHAGFNLGMIYFIFYHL